MQFLCLSLFVLPVAVTAFAPTIRTSSNPNFQLQRNSFYALSPDKQFEILSAAAVTVENATASAANATVTSATSTSKRRKVNPRDLTGYNYRDNEGEYDVPIINEPMWYRMVVRKNSEKKFVEYFLELKEKDPNWKGIIADAFYPQSSYVRFKGKALTMTSKPMVPGLIYLKTSMGPDIGDDLEGIKNIYGFTKNAAGLVLPLSHEEGQNLEKMRESTGQDLDPDVLKMKREEYVTVVDGRHKGRYGILMGAKSGRLEVCLRSDYKDEWDVFDARELRYLAEPPEKKWNEMTAKEAVESLMAKDPKNPTLKSLRDQGVLEEILYPDGRPSRRPRDFESSSSSGGVGGFDGANRDFEYGSGGGGREGGRSVRSIAKTDDSSSSDRVEGTVTGASLRVPAQETNWDADEELGGWNSGGAATANAAAGRSSDEPSSPYPSSKVTEYDPAEALARLAAYGDNKPWRRPEPGATSTSRDSSSAYGDNKPWRRPEPGSEGSSYNNRDASSSSKFSGGNDRFSSGNSGYGDSWSSEQQRLPRDSSRVAKKPALDDDFDSFIQGLLDGIETPGATATVSSNKEGARGGARPPSFGNDDDDDIANLLDDLDQDAGAGLAAREESKSFRDNRLSNQRSTKSIDDLAQWGSANSGSTSTGTSTGSGSGSSIWARGKAGQSQSDDELEKLFEGGDDIDLDDLFLDSAAAASSSPPKAAKSGSAAASRGDGKATMYNDQDDDDYDGFGSSSRSSSDKTSGGSSNAGASSSAAPRMEDFSSFEQYLDALVSHEKSRGAGGPRTYSSTTTSTSSSPTNNKRGGPGTAEGSANSWSRPTSTASVDDEILDILDDLPAAGAKAAPRSYSSGSTSSSSNSNKKNPSDLNDDLDKFFDDLISSENKLSSSKAASYAPAAAAATTKTGYMKRAAPEKDPAAVAAPAASVLKKPSTVATDYSSMTVKELKDVLKGKGLPVGGVKSELIERLSKQA